MSRLRFLGHNAWEVQTEKGTFLIDPFLTGNPVAVTNAESMSPEWIFVSHGHGDHLGDTLSIACRTNATVVTMVELGEWLKKRGVANVVGMNLGGEWGGAFGNVRMVPALHSSSTPDGEYAGSPCGWLFTLLCGTRIYFACDTALSAEMALLGREPLDVAVLPIGGHYTMGPEEALQAVKMLQPKVVIPCHYNTWPVIAQDDEKWASAVERETTTRVYRLAPGESFSLDGLAKM